MTRVRALVGFLLRDLVQSMTGIVPLAFALAFGIIAFEYGMDQAQFVTVGGIGTGSLCLLTTLLLASRANRAASYLLLTRLPRRSELLAALLVSGMVVTAVLSILLTLVNLVTGRLTLSFPSALWILPTWFVLWILAAALALPLSGLTGQGDSHLLGYVAVTALLVLNDQKARLLARNLDWLVRLVSIILWPVSTLLAHGSAGIHDRTYFIALATTLGSAVLLFGLADQLFEGKDLLWSE